MGIPITKSSLTHKLPFLAPYSTLTQSEHYDKFIFLPQSNIEKPFFNLHHPDHLTKKLEMCTRKSTQYLQCGHRKYGITDTSSCDHYNPRLQCCPKNEDVVKKNHRLCPDCETQLRETSYYLHFKVRNLGEEYVDHDWSAGNSPISSQNSEDYDERYRELQMEEKFDNMNMGLPVISEEDEIPKRIEDVGTVRLKLSKYREASQ
jgi:hypothetical protein